MEKIFEKVMILLQGMAFPKSKEFCILVSASQPFRAWNGTSDKVDYSTEKM